MPDQASSLKIADVMRSLLVALVSGVVLLIGTPSGVAQQVLCSEAPLCPDDGASPTGFVSPGCFCPRPASCPFPNLHKCTLGIPVGGKPFWDCQCEDAPPIDPPDCNQEPFHPDCPPKPIDPPPGLTCENSLSCPDGSIPIMDAGLHCTCIGFKSEDQPSAGEALEETELKDPKTGRPLLLRTTRKGTYVRFGYGPFWLINSPPLNGNQEQSARDKHSGYIQDYEKAGYVRNY